MDHQVNQSVGGQMAAGNEDEFDAALELARQFAQENCLAGSDFAGEEDKSFFPFDSVHQGSQSLKILWVAVEKSRVGCNSKRCLSETKKILQRLLVFLRADELDHRLTLL